MEKKVVGKTTNEHFQFSQNIWQRKTIINCREIKRGIKHPQRLRVTLSWKAEVFQHMEGHTMKSLWTDSLCTSKQLLILDNVDYVCLSHKVFTRKTMGHNCYLPRGWRENFTFLYQEKDSLLSSSCSWRGKTWIRIPLDCSLRTTMQRRKQNVTSCVVIFHNILLPSIHPISVSITPYHSALTMSRWIKKLCIQ